VGLLDAVRHFNPQGGSSFESYARVRIRGAIFDELRRLDWVPRSIHGKARKVQAIQQQLEQRKGALPTDDEMAEALNLSSREYDRLMAEIRPASFVCLDRTDADDDTEGYEVVQDPSQESPLETVTRRERARLVAERLQELPDMQKKVLALYYDQDLRLKEIAQVFGLTEARISQIHSKAILAIRGYLERQDDLA
jgi:RNA polymerase sigma factor for flagellar operon FliA